MYPKVGSSSGGNRSSKGSNGYSIIEGNPYFKKELRRRVDNGEISGAEEGFMEGYLDEFEIV